MAIEEVFCGKVRDIRGWNRLANPKKEGSMHFNVGKGMKEGCIQFECPSCSFSIQFKARVHSGSTPPDSRIQ